jgi:hypothetical protein
LANRHLFLSPLHGVRARSRSTEFSSGLGVGGDEKRCWKVHLDNRMVSEEEITISMQARLNLSRKTHFRLRYEMIGFARICVKSGSKMSRKVPSRPNQLRLAGSRTRSAFSCSRSDALLDSNHDRGSSSSRVAASDIDLE